MNAFERYADYYNKIYQDKDYKKEAAEADYLIHNFSMKPDMEKCSLLNIGCGTGKHDYEMTELGYAVKGIDISEKMIDIARNNYKKTIDSGSLSFDTGNFQNYRTDEKFDVVTSLFHVVSYQNTNKEVLDSFHTANLALKNDGIFLFDAWYGPGVLCNLPEKRIKRIEDKENLLIRYAQPEMHFNENITDVNYDVIVINKENSIAGCFKETHSMRYFFKPEISNMLLQEGFELLACLDCSTLKEAGRNSWTVYFIARKMRCV